jgi:hypothetical protein
MRNNSKVVKFNAEQDFIAQPKISLHNGATVGVLVDSIIEENYQLSKEVLKICFRNEFHQQKNNNTSILTAAVTLSAFIISIIALKTFLF